jgi:hypothetical protein
MHPIVYRWSERERDADAADLAVPCLAEEDRTGTERKEMGRGSEGTGMRGRGAVALAAGPGGADEEMAVHI